VASSAHAGSRRDLRKGSRQLSCLSDTDLVGQLEPDWSTCLLLPDSCTVKSVAIRSYVIDANRHDITTAQFAIYGKIEQGEIRGASFDLRLRPNRPDVALSQRRFRPYQLALVPRRAA